MSVSGAAMETDDTRLCDPKEGADYAGEVGAGSGIPTVAVSPALTLDVATALAKAMFAVGTDASMANCRVEIELSEATLEVALFAKQAIAEVWRDCANKICRSPERPDLCR